MKKAGTTSRIFLLEYFNTQECLNSSQACKNLQSRRNFQLIRTLVFEMKASQCRVVYVLESFTKKRKKSFSSSSVRRNDAGERDKEAGFYRALFFSEIGYLLEVWRASGCSFSSEGGTSALLVGRASQNEPSQKR